MLCSSEDTSPKLILHDIQSWAFSSEDGEPWVTEREVSFGANLHSMGSEAVASAPVKGAKEYAQARRFGAFAFALDDSCRYHSEKMVHVC